jgi:hypothetical protein
MRHWLSSDRVMRARDTDIKERYESQPPRMGI